MTERHRSAIRARDAWVTAIMRASNSTKGGTPVATFSSVGRTCLNTLRKYAQYGSVVAGAAAVAMALLFVGPAGTAHALASSNNIETPISLDTNAATGSNTFTTLAPITLTCDVVDVTAGAADGVAGITLTLGPGWTFLGGAAPTIAYAAWPAPDGQATGTIVSATSITDDIGTSCSPGSVVTFTGVQVKPSTNTSASATIIADINTADVTVARLTAVPGAAATHVNVETAADGSGTIVPSQSIAVGATVTGYAISRTAANAFVANVVGAWSLTAKTGGFLDGDLVPAGDMKSAVFTGHLAGTGVIHVTSGLLTPGDSGTMTVTVVPPPPPEDDTEEEYSPPTPTPTPTPAPTPVKVLLPLVPLAGIVPVVVPVPTAAACPSGSVVAPAVMIPPGVGEVALPPVEVPPGALLVCVPVVAPPGAVLAVVPQVAPRPAATGNGGLAEDGHAGAPHWPVALLAVGVAALAVAARRLVPQPK